MNEFEERVAAAANELERAGRKVTAQAICQAVGGSMRDICPALRKWREAKVKTEATASAMPEDVMAVFRKAESLVWSTVEARAAERIAAIETDCTSRISAAESERDESLEEIGRMESQLDTYCEEIWRMREAANAATALAAKAEAERDAAREKIVWLMEELGTEKRLRGDAISAAAELRGRLAALNDVFEGARVSVVAGTVSA